MTDRPAATHGNETPPDARSWVLGSLVLLVLCFLVGLGSFDLSAPDEPRYALVAREMIDEGHWLFLHRNDQPYAHKPPLFFWSIAILSLLNGGEVNAWTARLPSALSAIALLVLVALWAGDGRKERPLGLVTAMVLGTGFTFMLQAHRAQIDLLLCLLTTASLCHAYRDIRCRDAQRPWVTGLLWGLAVLAKGPVGYLVPAGALALYLLVSEDRKLRDFPVRALLWGLLPPALWLAGLLVESALTQQWSYVQSLVFKQTVVRYFHAWHHHQPFYYFLRVLLTDFFPWSPLLLLSLPYGKRAWRHLDEKQRFSLAMILFTLVFFSVSKGKRNIYILPLYPFAAYLVARFIHPWRLNPHVRMGMAWAALPLALLGLGLFGAAMGWFAIPALEDTGLVIPAMGLGLFALPMGCCGLAALMCIRLRRTKPAFGLIFASVVLLNLMVWQVLLPWIAPVRSARLFMEDVNRIVTPADPERPVGMVQFRAAYRFYGQRPLVELKTPDPEFPHLPSLEDFLNDHPRGWVIVREEHFEQYPEDLRARLHPYVERRVSNKRMLLLGTVAPK
ncbi:Glycosyltransferase family 39 protein [Sulfidibacter corallicola]|uniref:Glycosyltransferase family 39 protein n=1 Tax=Sulfidibacter corallicola TaxID=2818388 RepID=A0A8A4TP66_SULCO|nr:glycosyltransferase family 39 protein [Sulfidibacter corallicola]QTD50994.1 glycosyltransferase family 39 protein [Sulfidibacter corallicola]